MLGTMIYGPGDVRFEESRNPNSQTHRCDHQALSNAASAGRTSGPIAAPTRVKAPMRMGHEYCGVVVEVGSEVKTVKPGQFVVGSFVLSDNTCPHCRHGFQSSCEQREFMTGAQAPFARVPLADGTLVATDESRPTI